MIIQGDCLEEMPKIADKSIDMILTSPPYDNLRNYNGSLDWGEHIWKPVIKELYRVLKDGGVCVWIVGDATIKGSETGTSFKQALYFKEIGFNLHDTMIWEKTGQGAVGSIYCYWQNFEYMFVFSKGKPKSIHLIEDRKNQENERWCNGGRNKNGESTDRKWVKSKPFGRRFNMWKITPTCKSEHPAPFPDKLAEDHILSWSNEGDSILDPFAGSGTTGVACQNLKRDFILIEKELKYVEIIKQRLFPQYNQLKSK
jgi:site-specific DNA-methyltransferase (adenine-specific)